MTYTVEEAKAILRCDPDYSDDLILELIESAEAQLYKLTGIDYSKNPTPLSKKFVRMHMIQEYHEFSDDYDFTKGLAILATQLTYGGKVDE